MQKNISQLGMNSTGNLRPANDEQHNRLEAKLKRELGEIVLGFLADERTEDIMLNPDSSLAKVSCRLETCLRPKPRVP